MNEEVKVEPVTQEQFNDALGKNWNNIHILELTGVEVPILHGLIALAADHPMIGTVGTSTTSIINRIRQWCLDIFLEWGFTEGQVKYLDSMRERSAAGEDPLEGVL